MIVLEGPDGGGKSTLAEKLHRACQWPIIKSAGPPKDRDDLLARIENYHKMGNQVIFDRHPCISNIVYGLVGTRPEIPPGDIERFYAQKPLLIYCRSMSPDRAIADKPFDTAEHQQLYTSRYPDLVKGYDAWAITHAHYIHRIDQPYDGLIQAVRLHAYMRRPK